MGKIIISFFLILFFSLPLFAQSVETAWVRRYNGPGNGGENARDIFVDDSGYVYVTGYSPGKGTSADYATIKYHPNGDIVWVRRYNGPANDYDAAYALAVDNSGNVYVTGVSPGEGTFNDFLTIKYDSSGNEVWVRRYNGSANSSDRAYCLVLDKSKNIYVAGVSGVYPDQDYLILKYDNEGKELWAKRYKGPGEGLDEVRAIAMDRSGNLYVTGESYGVGTYSDFATIKYYPNGDTAWVKRYNGPANRYDRAYALKIDHSGNIYVIGGSEGKDTGYDFAIVKYDEKGNQFWVKRYNGPTNGYDEARAVALDDSGNIFVSGESSGDKTGMDYLTIKFHPDGDTAWVRRYNGPANGSDYPSDIAVDRSGNLYVTGQSRGAGTSIDYATIKYYPNGEVAWIERYNPAREKADLANAIAVDDSGNVYVTGRSEGSGTAYDYATIKYIQTQPQTNDSLR